MITESTIGGAFEQACLQLLEAHHGEGDVLQNVHEYHEAARG